MLPDRSVTILKIKRFATADKVYEVTPSRLSLSLDQGTRFLPGCRGEDQLATGVCSVLLSLRDSRLYVR